MSAEVADVLERAAARIEEVGKSGPGDRGTGPNGETCALNAIDYASRLSMLGPRAKAALLRQVGRQVPEHLVGPTPRRPRWSQPFHAAAEVERAS